MFNPNDILYEDNHLLVVNKRVGDLVQPDKTSDDALENYLKAFLKVRRAARRERMTRRPVPPALPGWA